MPTTHHRFPYSWLAAIYLSCVAFGCGEDDDDTTPVVVEDASTG